MATMSDEMKDRLLGMLDEIAARHEEVERRLADPEVTSDSARLARAAREHGRLSKFVAMRDEVARARQQAREAEESIGESDDDPEFQELARDELEEARAREGELLQQMVELLVTSEQDDTRSVIMEIRAGTGGEEAALFAMDLFRMYARYADKQGWKLEQMDSSLTDLGGAREIIFSITGKGVWRKLCYESGGHRVQRVPRTETQGRIHTSMATVAVLPEARDVDVQIDPGDVEMSFMRSSGPGGQNVNKISSCVRLVHKPTGITVRCQDQKSQSKNRKKAMDLLRARLYQLRQDEQRHQRDTLRRSQIGSGDRNERIRTYNFPQDRITDHRAGFDLFAVESFLMGECEAMFDALAAHDREQRIEALLAGSANLLQWGNDAPQDETANGG